MKLKSTLSAVVAKQMGTLEGRLKVYAQSTLNDLLEQLSNECPGDRELQRIVSVVSNIEKILTNYKRQITKYNTIVSKLDTTINSVSTLVNILKLLPIPTAVLGVGVPVGFTSRYGKALVDASDFLENLNEDKNAVVSIIRGANVDTTRIQSMIGIIKQKVDACISNNITGATQSTIAEGQRLSNDRTNLLNEPNLYTLEDGRQYVIDVITIQNEELSVPKRFAQAKDLNGVVIIKGETSYSSDKTILIEEVLFRLENL